MGEDKQATEVSMPEHSERCRSYIINPSLFCRCRRGFSYVKNTKTNSRNKLLDSHLTEQLTIVLESPPVGKLDPVPAIDLWNSTPCRVRQSQDMSSTSTGQVQAVKKTAVGAGVITADDIEAESDSDELVVKTVTDSAEIGAERNCEYGKTDEKSVINTTTTELEAVAESDEKNEEHEKSDRGEPEAIEVAESCSDHPR